MKTEITQPPPGIASENQNVRRATSVVMDVLPWPNGIGFAGGESWWGHVLKQSERERLDNLVCLALLDKGICEKLLTHSDPGLLSSFGLSEQTQNWLKNCGATTLKELAEAIAAATDFT